MTTTDVEGVIENVGTVRACLFLLAGEHFAVEVASAREVVVLEAFTVVPRGPAYLVGVTNLRGVVLPVVDIRPLLGLPARAVGPGTHLLVVEAASVQVGIVIERIWGLSYFDEVRPFTDSTRHAYGELGAGLLPQGNGVVTLLDVAKVVEALKKRGKGD